AERHNIPAYFDDATKMLDTVKPDIVSVCTPNMLHKPYVKAALESGAHVICEKPLALTYADAKELFELARSRGVMLCAAQSMRFTPDRLACKKLCESGYLGNACYGEFSRIRHRGIPEWGAFHIKEISGGGAFVDIGVHMLDALVWLMDNPKIVSVTGNAETRLAHLEDRAASDLKASGALAGKTYSADTFNKNDFNVEDFASGSILFEGGVRVNFKVAWAANLPDETSIILSGDRAGIRLPEFALYGDADKTDTDIRPEDFVDKRFNGLDFSGHYMLFENIAEHLAGKAELIVRPEETLTVSALIDMFYRSAIEKREVYFNEYK
ncbi:MAG: Gfo/Idh/MocA family oxidoreductase, partial [Clostridia bacterium]|nr:Gfo/Idh/MocA family oxidoreductase [Clostridia bacterium]